MAEDLYFCEKCAEAGESCRHDHHAKRIDRLVAELEVLWVKFINDISLVYRQVKRSFQDRYHQLAGVLDQLAQSSLGIAFEGKHFGILFDELYQLKEEVLSVFNGRNDWDSGSVKSLITQLKAHELRQLESKRLELIDKLDQYRFLANVNDDQFYANYKQALDLSYQTLEGEE